jgi:hypothetical protein
MPPIAQSAAEHPLPDATSGPAPAASAEWRCQWCGVVNSGSNERCSGCDAAAPRPEQDLAIERAAEERIRAATESIAAMQRLRTRRGLGRFFNS